MSWSNDNWFFEASGGGKFSANLPGWLEMPWLSPGAGVLWEGSQTVLVMLSMRGFLYIYICIYIYIYTYKYIWYTYIYIYLFIYVYVYDIYIYIYYSILLFVSCFRVWGLSISLSSRPGRFNHVRQRYTVRWPLWHRSFWHGWALMCGVRFFF